jgi:uncharacterized membrane protein
MKSASGAPFARHAEGSVQWVFKRNCSITPRQLALCFLLLGGVSLLVAGFFWSLGVPWIMPFTLLELSALAVAFFFTARHAANCERFELRRDELVVEQEVAGRVSREVFKRPWVRVENPRSRWALIEVCEGQRCVRCGHHIRPDQRQQVAQEIRLALRGS